MLIKISPVAAPRMTRRDKWAMRPTVLRYRAFRDEIRIRKVALPDDCKIVFHIPMPDSWSMKKKNSYNGKPHKQKPDLDNMVKALLDSLYEDDSHIWKINAEKRWAFDGAIEINETN